MNRELEARGNLTFPGRVPRRYAMERFDKVETSKRGKLLYNAIESAITGMGQAISEQEKRQVLMDVLRELC